MDIDAASQELDFNVQIQDNKAPTSMGSDDKNIEMNNKNDIKKNDQVINNDQQNAQVIEGQYNYSAQLFQLLFKSVAIFFKVIVFVLVIVVSAFDFWAVKNYTGRRLVGLRWWSQIQDDGQEVWTYESMDANFKPNECNSSVFWFSQTICTLIWVVLAFINLITLSAFWFILCSITALLCGTNWLGFYKCRGEHQKKAKFFVSKMGMKVLSNAF